MLSVMSFNVRVDVASDQENAWEYRKEAVVAFLNDKQIDIICLQEVKPHMLSFIKKHLTNYENFGEPRDKEDEYVVIFIKKNIFEVLSQNTFWLTETPFVYSKSSDSFFPRIATHVVLKLKNKMILDVFNTHLDYASEIVALNQIKTITQFSNACLALNHNVLIVGDFNALPDHKAIKHLTINYNIPYNSKSLSQLTFHGFQKLTYGKPIDYICYSKHMKLNEFHIDYTKPEHVYLSDHYPIYAFFDI